MGTGRYIDGRMLPLASFADGSLFGVRRGQGRPWVLALHGWQRSHRDFDAILDGFDAIALDLPGFGATPAPPEPWSTAEYAAAVARVLDEMAETVVVLGHSFGGRVSVHLAAAHPDRIGAQVLTGVPLTRAPGPRPRPPRTFRVGRALHGVHLVSAGRMEALRMKYGSTDYRNAVGVLRPILVKAVNEDYLRPLSAFPNPIELVWGEMDEETPPVVAEIAIKSCARGHLEIVPGGRHLTPQTAAAALRLALLRCQPATKASPRDQA
jgi:pimeloyl-ACP methyl ester carboxylesterase